MKEKFLFIFIFVFALSLRLYNLSSMPPHMNWDEVSHGYNAYSVLETGRDEWGEPYPTIFKAYGDYKLPVYIYSTMPFIKFFGLSNMAVRVPSALAGSFLVLATYFLVIELLKNKKIAFLAAILVAIEPWSFFTSRVALEANLSVFLLASGILLTIKGLKEKNNLHIIGSLLLGLSVWTYNSARVFAPLLLLTTALIYKKELFKNYLKNFVSLGMTVLLLSVFFVPMFSQLLKEQGSARYENVKILDQGAIGEIVDNRLNANYPEIIERVIYNRYIYFSKIFLANYVNHFSIGYLFDDGGDHYQFSVPSHGLLYSINFAFFVFGLFYISYRSLDIEKNKSEIFILSWLILAPIASSLTRESPHALRNLISLPIPMIISSYGFYIVYKNYNQISKMLIAIYVAILFLQFSNYQNVYYGEYKTKYSWAWQYGYSEVVDYISKNYDKYDKIIITKKYGEPHEFLLYYGAVADQTWADPERFRRDPNLIRFSQSNWYWVDAFDKFYFVNDWEIPQTNEDPFVLESGEVMNLSGKVLLVTSPGNYPIRFIDTETIYFLDGQPAFDLVKAEL